MSGRGSPPSLVLAHIVMWCAAATPLLVLLAGRGYPSGVVGDEGMLAGLWLLVWIAGVFVAGGAAVVLGVVHWLRGGRLLPRWVHAGLAVGLFVAGVAMIRFDALLTMRFALARAEFDRVTAGELPRMPAVVGGYRVLDAARDPRGGTYYITGSMPDLIDSWFFGFAKDPNPEGSPVGNKQFRLEPLGGGWYRFEANNDF